MLYVFLLRISPERRLKNITWKASLGRLKKKVVATSISDQSKTSLRPKIRRFYDVSVSVGWEGNTICPVHIERPGSASKKEVPCMKTANKQNPFKQNPLPTEKNSTCKHLNLWSVTNFP